MWWQDWLWSFWNGLTASSGVGTGMPSTMWHGRETGTTLASYWVQVLPFSGLSAPEGGDPTMVEHQIVEDLSFSTAC